MRLRALVCAVLLAASCTEKNAGDDDTTVASSTTSAVTSAATTDVGVTGDSSSGEPDVTTAGSSTTSANIDTGSTADPTGSTTGADTTTTTGPADDTTTATTGDATTGTTGGTTEALGFASCAELTAAFKAEQVAIRGCDADAQCGQVLEGTGCGCIAENLVARLDADPDTFFAMLAAAQDFRDCSLLGPFTCGCPQADSFECLNGMCEWDFPW